MFLNELIQPVIDVYKDAYPEVIEQKEMIERVMLAESEQFMQTLDSGEKILETEIERLKSSKKKFMSGELAFTLESTYGFPADMTGMIIKDYGLEIDLEELKIEREKHKEVSKRGILDQKKIFDSSLDIALKSIKKTKFAGYEKYEADSKNFVVLDAEGNEIKKFEAGFEVYLFSDVTPFYAEKGGQVGDTGKVKFGKAGKVKIINCDPREDMHRHILLPDKEIDISKVKTIKLAIDVERRKNIVRHHTATHLLHYALREVLGKHVSQKGSLVTHDRLRFDFTHLEALTPEQIAEVERVANELVLENYVAVIEETDIETAKKKGAIALFGEKYSETVRTISVGPSMELCGGTHVRSSGEIGQIRIISETSVAQGVRRIEAIAGLESVHKLQEERTLIHNVSLKLKTPGKDLLTAVERLQNQIRTLKEEVKKAGLGNSNEFAQIFSKSFKINNAEFIVEYIKDLTGSELEKISDVFRANNTSCGVVLIGGEEGKLQLIAGFTKDLTKKGLNAGKIITEISAILGGKGGGAAHFAKGGGKDETKINDALEKAKELLKNALS